MKFTEIMKELSKEGKSAGKDYSKYDSKEMKMGIGVEYEHTTQKELATKIAADHLEEFPDYYTRLDKMEKEAENYWKEKKDE